MTHDEKVAYLLNDLTQRGVGKFTAAPPAYRLLWRLGFEVRPPHFASFAELAVPLGVFFGVVWGLLMWLVAWRGNLSIVAALVSMLVAGAIFGVIMAAYYRRQAGKLGLPRWEDYPPSRA